MAELPVPSERSKSGLPSNPRNAVGIEHSDDSANPRTRRKVRRSSKGSEARIMNLYQETSGMDLRLILAKSTTRPSARSESVSSTSSLQRQKSEDASTNLEKMPMQELAQLLKDVQSEHSRIVIKSHFPFVFIPPEASFLDHWNFAILLLVLMQSVTLPVEACFDQVNSVLGVELDYVVLGFFFADLLLNFTLSYPNSDGQLVFGTRSIAVRAHTLRTMGRRSGLTCAAWHACYRYGTSGLPGSTSTLYLACLSNCSANAHPVLSAEQTVRSSSSYSNWQE